MVQVPQQVAVWTKVTKESLRRLQSIALWRRIFWCVSQTIRPLHPLTWTLNTEEAASSEMLIVTNQTTRYNNCNLHFYSAEKLLSRVIWSFVLTDCALQCSHYKQQPFAHLNVCLTNNQLTPWSVVHINTLNAELNPICSLLALLAHHFLHVSKIRVKSLTLRLIMSYIYIYIYIYIWSAYSWCF